MERRGIDAIVGANVRGRRSGLDMRQPELAGRMTALGHEGWGAATVSRVESGKRSTSTAELLGLGLALGATPEDLLDPTTYGDESDVGLGVTFKARDLRAVIRGNHRPRVNFAGEVLTYELAPTNRIDVFVTPATATASADIPEPAVGTEPGREER